MSVVTPRTFAFQMTGAGSKVGKGSGNDSFPWRRAASEASVENRGFSKRSSLVLAPVLHDASKQKIKPHEKIFFMRFILIKLSPIFFKFTQKKLMCVIIDTAARKSGRKDFYNPNDTIVWQKRRRRKRRQSAAFNQKNPRKGVFLIWALLKFAENRWDARRGRGANQAVLNIR